MTKELYTNLLSTILHYDIYTRTWKILVIYDIIYKIYTRNYTRIYTQIYTQVLLGFIHGSNLTIIIILTPRINVLLTFRI